MEGPHMDIPTTLTLAFVAVVLVAAMAYSCYWPQARRERLVRDFATRRSLDLDAEAAELAERLLVSMQKGRGVAAAVAAVLAYPILAAAEAVEYRNLLASIVLVIVGAQIAAAAGGAIALHRAARSPSSQRAAHLSPLRLDDFLPPALRWWPLAALAVSTAAVGIALVAQPDDPILEGRDLVIAWVTGLAAVVATEVTSQVLLRAPQRAESPATLAVHDEIKSDLLTVVTAGAIGPTLITAAVTAELLPGADVPVAVALILPLVVLESRRRRRVHQRLWSARPTTVGGPPTAP